MEQESILNRFLVEIFHELLRREDEAIAAGGYPELSSREMDVIKTVCAASDQENSSREIAQRLRITAGTLSAAAKALERKGYLRRRRDHQDKRIVHLEATDAGRQANAFHEEFHRRMIHSVLEQLTPEEAHAFAKALEAIAAFFQNSGQR